MSTAIILCIMDNLIQVNPCNPISYHPGFSDVSLLPFSGNRSGYSVVVLHQALLGTTLLVQWIVVTDMLAA